MILKVIQLSRSGRPAGVHCDYSDGMPLFPSMVREVAGMNGAHPTLSWHSVRKRPEHILGQTNRLFSKP